MSSYIAHYGIKNMKWYHRRYQNSDGSLTPLGRIRYGVGQATKTYGQSVKNGSKKVAKAGEAVGKLSKAAYDYASYSVQRKADKPLKSLRKRVIDIADSDAIANFQQRSGEKTRRGINRIRSYVKEKADPGYKDDTFEYDYYRMKKDREAVFLGHKRYLDYRAAKQKAIPWVKEKAARNAELNSRSRFVNRGSSWISGNVDISSLSLTQLKSTVGGTHPTYYSRFKD